MKFRLINVATGLTLGQFKCRHPLTYYCNDKLRTDSDYKHHPVQAFVRADGAVGFQVKFANSRFAAAGLRFLKREEWELEVQA